jgi:hypothetical protein
MGNTLKFVLSTHNGSLGKIRATKETTGRHKSHQWLISRDLFWEQR